MLLLSGAARATETDPVPFDTSGPQAPYTPGVPFGRASPARQLGCDGDRCLWRGGAGSDPAAWPARAGCTVRGTSRSENFLGFARTCRSGPTGEPGARWELGVVALDSGVATWTNAPRGQGGAEGADVQLSAGEHLLWFQERSPMPTMVATTAVVLRLPRLEPAVLMGSATRESVAAAHADDPLVATAFVPEMDPRWTPSMGFEVRSYVESLGGCAGVYGLAPRGCRVDLRYSLASEPPGLTDWRVAYCYSDTDETARSGAWQPLGRGVFVRPGSDPKAWRWAGLRPGETPCMK